MRLIAILISGIFLAAASFNAASAQDYPNRTVRMVLPFTPGAAPDLLARVVAQKLSEKWGQGVVVDNRAGGNTMIGTTTVTRAAPDGYTLLLTADQTFILNPLLYSNLPYSMKDLTPIILLASVPHILAVAERVPASNVRELIALAKQKPDTLLYGSSGDGTIQRLAAEYFSGIAGIKMTHVPYKGATEAVTAIIAQQIDLTITGMPSILPHMNGGKLKALAISTAERHPLAPDVPTMQEAGVPGYTSRGAFGLFSPAGTPQAINDKIAKDVADVLQQPDVVKTLQAQSFFINSEGPAQFAKTIDSETEKWRDVIKRLNIKLE